MFEGRKSFIKSTGNFRFEASQSNISLYLSAFPDAKVIDDQSDKFEQFVVNDRPKFEFKREPLWWQEEAFEKFKNVGPGTKNPYPCFAFLYDPGGGKSKSLTDASCYLWTKGQIDAVIIIAPNDLVANQWPENQLPRDIQENIPYESWKWKKTKKGIEEYEKMKMSNGLKIVSMNIDACRTKKGFDLLVDFIKHHKGRVMFALDESHLAKNQSSQRHKSLADLMGMCNWRSILTGTLIAKNLVDAWAQFKLLHQDILGYKYMSAFRSHFCETKWNGFAEEIIGHKNLDEFYKLIEPYSYRISKSELGLEQIEDEFTFEMHPDQKKAFKELKEAWLYKLDNGEFLTVANALSGTVRMQQVTCGFLPREDGTLQLFKNSRLDALEAWLETQGNEKIMIWCRFKDDVRFIMNRFKDICVDFSGNVDADERQKSKHSFINNDKIILGAGTPDAAGTGVDDLQTVCNRALYYSHNYNSIHRWQSRDRTSRVGGIGNTSFYTSLVCKGGVDRRQLNNLAGKTDLSRMTLDDIRKEFE